MGKNKRQKLQSSKKSKPKHQTLSRPAGICRPSAKAKVGAKQHIQAHHSTPTIPFTPSDRILLIGEGDLSFARSLVEHHACKNVTATLYESKEGLLEKYPHSVENVRVLEEKGAVVKYGVDVMKTPVGKKGLAAVGREGVDRVVFNFPHVGGRSTDVNRQVRYNQEMLAAFFTHALPVLSNSTTKEPSSIIVTLFEASPYTLWNIRDVARTVGLAVEKSFRFQAGAYPGYRHARTLGVVKNKSGVVGGGWKGEERAARSYVFVRKGEEAGPGLGKGRKLESSDEEDMDEEDEEEDEEFEDYEHENDQNEEDGEEGNDEG